MAEISQTFNLDAHTIWVLSRNVCSIFILMNLLPSNKVDIEKMQIYIYFSSDV